MKMKIIVAILLMSVLPNGFATVYWASFGWSQAQYDIDLQAGVKAMANPNVGSKKPLSTTDLSGFGLKGDKLLQVSGSTFGSQIGRLEKCAGLGGTCIVVDGKFKIFIPKDFNFKTQKNWQWQNYKYRAGYKYQSELLGVPLNFVHVVATCSDCDFPIFSFDIDEHKGITEMEIESFTATQTYVLSDGTGFYAKDKAGNYTF